MIYAVALQKGTDNVVSGGNSGDVVRDRFPGSGLAGGVAFKRPNEQAWARLFDALGEPWKYEALEPEISRAIRYQPDFWLPQRLVWIEIKSGPPTPGEIRVARQLLEATGRRVYVLDGWPWSKSFGVSLFTEAGDVATRRADWCELALCQLLDVGFSKLREGFRAVRKRSK